MTIRVAARAVLAIGLVAMSTECTGKRAGPRGLNAQGSSWHFTLAVTTRHLVLPDQSEHASVVDSIMGTLTIDTAVGDSLVGHFDMDVAKLGISAGTISGKQLFAGSMRGDSLQLYLFSDATDAGIYLDGRVDGSDAVGVWTTSRGFDKGRFHLLREK